MTTTTYAPNSPERLKGAYERGDAAAYYGRHHEEPCIRLPGDGMLRNLIQKEDMTPEEIREYHRGAMENPSDQKDWR